MKIRNGFVSNSSSSSFVVFSSKPIDRKLLEEKVINPVPSEYDKQVFEATDVINYIAGAFDISTMKIDKNSRIMEELMEYFEDCIKWTTDSSYMYIVKSEHTQVCSKLPQNIIDAFNVADEEYSGCFSRSNGYETYRAKHEAFQKILKPYVQAKLKELNKQYKYVEIFEASDNDGMLGCTVEHGTVMYDIFEKCFRISHH